MRELRPSRGRTAEWPPPMDGLEILPHAALLPRRSTISCARQKADTASGRPAQQANTGHFPSDRGMNKALRVVGGSGSVGGRSTWPLLRPTASRLNGYMYGHGTCTVLNGPTRPTTRVAGRLGRGLYHRVRLQSIANNNGEGPRPTTGSWGAHHLFALQQTERERGP